MRLSQIRLPLDRLRIRRNSTGAISFLIEHSCEIKVRQRFIRPGFNRFSITAFRPIEPMTDVVQ